MLTFTNEHLRDKVKSEAPGNDAVARAVDNIDFLPFPQLEESVKADVNFLKENPLILEGTTLTGWIYDVTTGKVKSNSHCTIFIRNPHFPPDQAGCLNTSSSGITP
jgi:carbonic anhydrase